VAHNSAKHAGMALLPGLLAAGFRIDDYDLMMATPDLDLPTAPVYHPGLGLSRGRPMATTRVRLIGYDDTGQLGGGR
jgi:hypothetical protein